MISILICFYIIPVILNVLIFKYMNINNWYDLSEDLWGVFLWPIFLLYLIVSWAYELLKWWVKLTPRYTYPKEFGYRWGDKIKYKTKDSEEDAIYLYWSWNKYDKASIVVAWERTSKYVDFSQISPIFTKELKEELQYLHDANELERQAKDFLAQAEKVRAQWVRAKIANIVN